MGGPRTAHDPVTAGWDALRTGQWQRARACFEQALATAESAEALEGLGWSAYCLDDAQSTLDARERAYRLYREEGDDQSAARVAAWLAADWAEFRGETAVCSGWLQRAHRLLAGSEPGPGHGWLAVHEASMIQEDQPARAQSLAVEAAELGRRFGVIELEALGLALEGSALVSAGDLDRGMKRLDEATAIALSGEAELLVCVAWTCCYLISACEQVRDYDRASQWCRHAGEFCERHGIGLLLSVCRAKYAGVLTWQGRREEAEREATEAAEGLAYSGLPWPARRSRVWQSSGGSRGATTTPTRCSPAAKVTRAPCWSKLSSRSTAAASPRHRSWPSASCGASPGSNASSGRQAWRSRCGPMPGWVSATAPARRWTSCGTSRHAR